MIAFSSNSSKRNPLSYALLPLVALGLAALLPKSAAAQDDPPGRVARLNFIQGSVSYQVSGDQDWVQADPNRPLTTGDNLWVDQDSRGEVHIGSTGIRMSSNTGISFLTLDDRTVQLQLAQGTIEVHVRHLASGDAFEVDTPNLAFTIDRGGEYRIQTDPNGGSTAIIVREGQGDVTGGGDSWDLPEGQQYTFNGTDQISYDAVPAPDFDDFEDWCQSRDQRENSSQSAKYVSRDVDGYYDLDQYGHWQTDPDYGQVWIPDGVAAGWAPYQVGHWVYVAPWGWTWVDAEPWGFAPFHYGRWAFVGGGWGWVPGPVVVRPVYAPALVGFVGGGFGVSFAIGGGFAGVGWFPLGPRDVFVPGYHVSPRYFQNINVTNTRIVNVTQVTNVYTNVYVNHNTTVNNNYTYARNATAVTAVSRDTFVNARPVAGATVRVSEAQIGSAHAVESAPIAPTRSSYISASAKVATNRPAVPFSQRPVVAKLNPAVSRPSVQPATNKNRSFGAAQGNPQYNSRGNNGNTPQNQPASRDGFKPFQPPAGGNTTQPANRNGSEANTNESNANKNENVNKDQSNVNRNQNNNQGDQRPAVRFTPPEKADDKNYDVHPPLNQKPAQPEAKPESQPAPKKAQKEEKKEPKKDEKEK